VPKGISRAERVAVCPGRAERKVSEIVTDYFVALEKYGRAIGPFEKGRTCVYNATATAKRGPRVEQPSPDDLLVPPERWWDQ